MVMRFQSPLVYNTENVQTFILDKNTEQIALGHRVLSAFFTPKHS